MTSLHQSAQAALAALDAALAARPDDALAWYNRGLVLIQLRRTEDALASFDRAVALRPDFVEALNNRGTILRLARRFEDALASYDAALAQRPDHAGALNNRGVVLCDLHRPEEALASYDAALAIQPDAEAFYNRGSLLRQLGRHVEALTSFDAALAMDPDFSEALHNRGATLLDLKRFEAARGDFARVLALDPGHPYALSGLAQAALNLCDWAGSEALAGELKTGIEQKTSIVSPFLLLGYSSDPALLRRCAEQIVADKLPATAPPLWHGAPYRHKKIRLAYLSADFRDHATAFLTAELFERHDRSRFEVLAISFGQDDGGAMRTRLTKGFDRFHDVRAQSDREVAELLRAAEVDIAVDLKGHTTHARPFILAHRPAPVQVNYLGFPGTMGARYIDYLIADTIAVPPEQQPFFAEQLVYLPDSYQANDSRRPLAAKTTTRAAAGLPERGFVFCCFNNSWKITAPLFDIWMRLLAAVPGSLLWLLHDNDGATGNLRRHAASRGIDPGRLVFAPRTTLEDHLARHALADLMLDTMPYNAHTTASDALWTGLPLVTCRGHSFAGRVAASLLHAAGLPELVTATLEDYEALALRLARDAALLEALRRKLDGNRQSCALFDTERFRRAIEAAYSRMWETAERGLAPQGFSVTPRLI